MLQKKTIKIALRKSPKLDVSPTGLTVLSILIAYRSILRWASPNVVNTSLAWGCGSRQPMFANTSPNAEHTNRTSAAHR